MMTEMHRCCQKSEPSATSRPHSDGCFSKQAASANKMWDLGFRGFTPAFGGLPGKRVPMYMHGYIDEYIDTYIDT